MDGRFTVRSFAAVVVFVAVGCGEPDDFEQPLPKSQWGRADTIRYFVPGYPDPFPATGLAFTASELTGIEFVESDANIGAIAMVPIRDEPLSTRELGEYSAGTCTPWVSFDPTTTIHFPHMVGHAAGLNHTSDSCNFMHDSIGASEYECDDELFADDDQIDELRAFAWALENVCGEWE